MILHSHARLFQITSERSGLSDAELRGLYRMFREHDCSPWVARNRIFRILGF